MTELRDQLRTGVITALDLTDLSVIAGQVADALLPIVAAQVARARAEGAREALTAAAAGIEADAQMIARFASHGMNAVGLVAQLLRGRAAALDVLDGGAE